MEQPKSLLDLVLDPVEGDRVLAVAQLLYQADSHVRALSLMLGGLAAKAEPATARDLYAIQQSAESVCDWLSANWIPLYDHSTQTPAQSEQARPLDSTVH